MEALAEGAQDVEGLAGLEARHGARPGAHHLVEEFDDAIGAIGGADAVDAHGPAQEDGIAGLPLAQKVEELPRPRR